MLEKTEGAIKDTKSRDTGNNGYTRHRTKTTKTKQTTQKTKKMRNTDTTKYQVLTPVLMKSKQFMPLIGRPACYLYSPDVFDTTLPKQTQN
jgi:Pyruvate/2-oxoacid:ferredoxin oxidoreductase delta subunit